MKRLHVHVSVKDLDRSIRFYSELFAAAPTVRKPDYAKWMLEDPRVNFAISQRDAARVGVNHLGFQVESDGELTEIHSRLQAAGSNVIEERNVSCCYARSDKYWTKDPAGLAWESFHSLGSVPIYGETKSPAEPVSIDQNACGTAKTACCG